MNKGYLHYGPVSPAIVFKVNSSGSIEWKKTLDSYLARNIIQTNDLGYEITGNWQTTGPYNSTASLIKLGDQGNVQWVKNYSSISDMPDFGVSSFIQTSDGGFVYWASGIVTKCDPENITQWVKSITYYVDVPTINYYPSHQVPLPISSVIETSDGSIAILGVGYSVLGNYYTGKIYLIKTEPFLPTPSQTLLPTPISTASPTPYLPPDRNAPHLDPIFYLIPIAVIFVAIVVSVLLYKRHRKTSWLSQESLTCFSQECLMNRLLSS
jgi:hypothetical protein